VGETVLSEEYSPHMWGAKVRAEERYTPRCVLTGVLAGGAYGRAEELYAPPSPVLAPHLERSSGHAPLVTLLWSRSSSHARHP
jgi:hypothetical protein